MRFVLSKDLIPQACSEKNKKVSVTGEGSSGGEKSKEMRLEREGTVSGCWLGTWSPLEPI